MKAFSIVFILSAVFVAGFVYGATPEDLRAALAAADGVERAVLQTDDQGNLLTEPMVPVVRLVDGLRVQVEMKGTEGYLLARITYIVKDGDVYSDNTVAITITPDGTAGWHHRPPTVLAVRQEAPTPIATPEDLHAAIVAAGHPKVEKMQVQYGADYADVSGYSDVSGKLVEVRYLVAKDAKNAWVVKVYEKTVAFTAEPAGR